MGFIGFNKSSVLVAEKSGRKLWHELGKFVRDLNVFCREFRVFSECVETTVGYAY